ncbi:hypothetical protein MTZ49_10065 [Entomomonas sp. E2T0]|uniref:hypothetical protein n=1 Tax=Entomomonas sp. E2T0 TaxID=2930213 RepID=UPI0022284DCF|nr:hypothetical protein [Entomomonas sp. E2T0]UYZ82954.1 hypothetical protein MTZ49_10065 [Entomomonas sp. E2T0]
MAIKDYIIPDEIQSAVTSGKTMFNIAKKTSHFWLKQSIALILPIIIGCVIGWIITYNLKSTQYEDINNIISIIITILTVLSGFMVTLMLFTGRTSGAKTLTVDQISLYINKVSYLFFSQTLTLFIHIVCIILCLIWFIFQETTTNPTILNISLITCIGFFNLSLLRILILPFQIYEIHYFELISMEDEKLDEFDSDN